MNFDRLSIYLVSLVYNFRLWSHNIITNWLSYLYWTWVSLIRLTFSSNGALWASAESPFLYFPLRRRASLSCTDIIGLLAAAELSLARDSTLLVFFELLSLVAAAIFLPSSSVSGSITKFKFGTYFMETQLVIMIQFKISQRWQLASKALMVYVLIWRIDSRTSRMIF